MSLRSLRRIIRRTLPSPLRFLLVSLLKMTRFSISLQQGDVLLSLLLVPAVFLVYSSCCLSTLLRIAPAFALLQSPQPTISGGAGSIIFSQHRAAQPISFSHSTFPSSPSSLSLPQSTRDDVGPVQTGQADDSSRRHVAFLSASPATGLLGAGRENNRSLRPSSSRRSTSPVGLSGFVQILSVRTCGFEMLFTLQTPKESRSVVSRRQMLQTLLGLPSHVQRGVLILISR